MVSVIETVDVHLDRAHAALQYLDQGLRSTKLSEQIKVLHEHEKIIHTYGGITVILDAIWLKLIDYGLKCLDILQPILLSCLHRIIPTLKHVSNSVLLCERINKVYAIDDAIDHMPARLKELIENGLSHHTKTIDTEDNSLKPFLVKSSIRVIDAALQKTRFDSPTLDFGVAKQIEVDVLASGVPNDMLQIDLFVSTSPYMPPHQSLSHIKIADVNLMTNCVANRCENADIDMLPYSPSLAGKLDSGTLYNHLTDDQRLFILKAADANPFSCSTAKFQDYPYKLGERDEKTTTTIINSSSSSNLLPHYRWFHPVDSNGIDSPIRFQTTCTVRGNEDISWEFWDKRRASRRWAGKELNWFIYIVVRSCSSSSISSLKSKEKNALSLNHSSISQLPDYGGIYCVAG